MKKALFALILVVLLAVPLVSAELFIYEPKNDLGTVVIETGVTGGLDELTSFIILVSPSVPQKFDRVTSTISPEIVITPEAIGDSYIHLTTPSGIVNTYHFNTPIEAGVTNPATTFTFNACCVGTWTIEYQVFNGPGTLEIGSESKTFEVVDPQDEAFCDEHSFCEEELISGSGCVALIDEQCFRRELANGVCDDILISQELIERPIEDCQSFCGDGHQDAGEDCNSCPQDVGYPGCEVLTDACGNGVCQNSIGETSQTCSLDCQEPSDLVEADDPDVTDRDSTVGQADGEKCSKDVGDGCELDPDKSIFLDASWASEECKTGWCEERFSITSLKRGTCQFPQKNQIPAQVCSSTLEEELNKDSDQDGTPDKDDPDPDNPNIGGTPDCRLGTGKSKGEVCVVPTKGLVDGSGPTVECDSGWCDDTFGRALFDDLGRCSDPPSGSEPEKACVEAGTATTGFDFNKTLQEDFLGLGFDLTVGSAIIGSLVVIIVFASLVGRK